MSDWLWDWVRVLSWWSWMSLVLVMCLGFRKCGLWLVWEFLGMLLR